MRHFYRVIVYFCFIFLFFSKTVRGEPLQLITSSLPLSHFHLTSPFGLREHPLKKALRHHDGVDLSAPRGTPIYAVGDGLVAFAGWFGGYGKFVVIFHQNGITSHYAHCSSINVKVGEIVRAGDRIARVGDTGAATGTHLHFEIRKNGVPVDPLNYLLNAQWLL